MSPWNLVAVLALGCLYLGWYGLRMGWRLHQEQNKVITAEYHAKHWHDNYDIVERKLAAFERATFVTISAEDRVTPVMERLRTRIGETIQQMAAPGTRPCSEVAYSADRASTSASDVAFRPLLAIRHPEDFAAEFKEGHVAPDGAIWSTPIIRHTQGLVRVAVGEREKAEMFGWEWAGWDGKDQCNLMRHA